MSKKYELTGEVNAQGLKRIRSLVEIKKTGVQVGDLGGWIEKEENLEHTGSCWVSGNARISGNAYISSDARISKTSDYLVITPVGSENGSLTAFRTEVENEVKVNRGCFNDSLEVFEEAVKSKHGDNTHGKQYALTIALVKHTFGVN